MGSEASLQQGLHQEISNGQIKQLRFRWNNPRFPLNHFTNDITFVKKNINSFNDESNTDLSFLTETVDNIFLKMDIERWVNSLVVAHKSICTRENKADRHRISRLY